MKKVLLVVVLVLLSPLTAFAQSPDSNTLTWNLLPNAIDIRVESKPVACGAVGTWTAKTPFLAGDAITFTDANLADPFAWCYRLQANYVGGLSGYSSEAGKAPDPANLRVQ